jgi:phosphatidylserine decarboxylase
MSFSAAARAQYLIPQRLLSRFIYRLARCRARLIKNALIGWFARHYDVALDEATVEDPRAYDSFNAFFTRALKPAARPLDNLPDCIVSPVDGTLTLAGIIDGQTLLQAKGQSYLLSELLGEADVTDFEGGRYLTVYLAPHDYHRIHAPVAGRLIRTRYLPGTRFSVNEATAKAVPRLFCRNERAVIWLEGRYGRLALVLVGALNVSSISTTTLGEIPSGPPRHWHEPAPVSFEIGDELGRFNLGSTIVLLLPRATAEWLPELTAKSSVRMGRQIGRLTAGTRS